MQATVPNVIDVDQDSDVVIVQPPGVRRAQLKRVSNLLRYYHPPTHVKGEVSAGFCVLFFSSFFHFLFLWIARVFILIYHLMFVERKRPSKLQMSNVW